jgi:hypothetical protein
MRKGEGALHGVGPAQVLAGLHDSAQSTVIFELSVTILPSRLRGKPLPSVAMGGRAVRYRGRSGRRLAEPTRPFLAASVSVQDAAMTATTSAYYGPKAIAKHASRKELRRAARRAATGSREES